MLGGRLLFDAVRRIDASPAGARRSDLDADLARWSAVSGWCSLLRPAHRRRGWILGEPLPLVIALVIAGVDVVETSFLLVVEHTGSKAEAGPAF